MKLPLPFIQLPLTFDAARLAAEIDALGESVWMPHPQGFPGNSMLPLIAANGEAANESFAGEMRATTHLERCPYLQQTIAALGVVAGRSRLMRLSGHAEVTLHADQGYYWTDRVRVHIPIVTQPTVRFECGGLTINMAAGECWIFDTWRQHRVLNDAVQSRIHLVVDTVGGDAFWNLVGQGRDHERRALAERFESRLIAPDPQAARQIVFERANVPRVMTPWELNARIGFLFAEAEPHPSLQQLHPIALRFRNQWLALWAAHGEREDGWPAYRAAADAFLAETKRLCGKVLLKNRLGFALAMEAQVGKMAVASSSGVSIATSADEYTPLTPSQPSAAPVPPPPGDRAASVIDAQFERPVFVVSSPRSGSTMLFEALATANGIYTIGGESHALIEGVPELSPVSNGLGSNRLVERSATRAVAKSLRQRFLAALTDRDGARPGTGRLRMLEKTPKNSLRIPFLAQVFPEAEFLYLYRDPRETLGSMIDAWNSGRFKTYPGLPGWQGLPWSLLLVPGWPQLVGKPLGEIVATQWETATRLMLDDLAALPPSRVHTTRYERLVAAPDAELRRLSQALGLHWDRPVDGTLPHSRYTLSKPAPDKWRRHAAEIEPHLARLEATMRRSDAFTRN
jgi:hypothetical protein